MAIFDKSHTRRTARHGNARAIDIARGRSMSGPLAAKHENVHFYSLFVFFNGIAYDISNAYHYSRHPRISTGIRFLAAFSRASRI
jgi:hypothetical protein